MSNDQTNNNGETRITAQYIRLTKDESVKRDLSAPAQIRDIGEYASRNGLVNLELFQEPVGVGGDTPFAKRQRGRELIEQAKAGKIAHIIVRDVDRLTRDLWVWKDLFDLCIEQGITIHTLSGVLPATSPSDRFSTVVRVAAAQLEREQTGDRIRRVKRELARRGLPVGGPPVFGYTSQARRRRDLINAGLDEQQASAQARAEYPQAKHLYFDETEAIVVRKMFELYVQKRMGGRQIANELNRRGHRRRSGKPWVASRITRMIGNPVYCGYIPFDEERYKKGRGPFAPQSEQTLYKSQHKPIIDEEMWRKAQEIKKNNSSHAPKRGDASVVSRKYPLAGVLECACGSTMRSASTQRKIRQGSYVCRKRFHYGPNAVGGCDLPRVSIPKAHAAFWPKLGEIIQAPRLVDEVYQAAQLILAERDKPEIDEVDPQQQLEKLTADIDVWYARHDSAQSDVEKEASWRRIVQLLESQKQLEREIANEPPPRPRAGLEQITRKQIREHLADLAKAIPKSKDGGVALVQSLVEHHGLRVRLVDAQTMVIHLAFRPPSVGADESVGHAVEVETEAPLPISKVDAWLQKHEGKLNCKLCGQPIKVNRHHYWQGLPKAHRECLLAETSRRRANPSNGFLNGEQVARVLGIGRTTVGRWMKRGKLKPDRKQHGVWLFDEAEIERFATELSDDRLDPVDGHMNGEQVAKLCGVSRATVGRWMKKGTLVPVQKQQNVCLFDRDEVERFAKLKGV